MPAKKRKVYEVPVRLEWTIRIPADNKEQAARFAEGRLNVITSFGANEGRKGIVERAKIRLGQ